MKRLTGTSVYAYVKCPRQAALDLHLERAARRPSHAWEEFAARRGREHEARFVADLGAAVPAYPERDFAAGARATRELLVAGVPLVHQGVLLEGDRLGIPDLLRCVEGRSAFGDHHYEVLDIKSSARVRSDQILQVVFYARLLGSLQGRLPEHGGIVLKDGREERFAIRDYDAVAAEVEVEVARLARDPDLVRPFRQAGCDSCHWNHRCLPEMAAAGDLSLVHAMSQGARAILEGLGVRTIADLATFAPEGARARGNLDAMLVRRLRRGAQAALLGRPIAESRPSRPLDPAALVGMLADPYADRVLAFGCLWPATAAGRFTCVCPPDRDAEWDAFQRLLADLPANAHLLHFGDALPRWYEDQAFVREAGLGWSAMFVELGRRLRGAAVWPAPVFGLHDFVRAGLQRDPLRHGHPGEAAIWVGGPDAEERLRAKLEGDLRDLAELKLQVLDAPAPAASADAEAGAVG